MAAALEFAANCCAVLQPLARNRLAVPGRQTFSSAATTTTTTGSQKLFRSNWRPWRARERVVRHRRLIFPFSQ